MKNQPALKAALILIPGIIAAPHLEIPFHILFFIVLFLTLVTLILFLTKKFNSLVQILITFSLCSIGFLRYNQATKLFPSNHIIHILNTKNPVTLQGYLTKDPSEKTNRYEIIIKVETLTLHHTTSTVCGKILTSIYKPSNINLQYGDQVSITGQLQRPKRKRNPGGFDYRAYLERKNIHGILKIAKGTPIQPTGKKKGNLILLKIIYPVRRFVIQTIDRITTGESQSLLRALITGQRGTITPEVRDSFAKAGVIHVLAVSGLHVSFVLLIFLTIFGLFRLPYSAKVLLTILCLIFYTLLTQAKAPVVRATTMASLYLFGTLIQRQTNPFNIISLAALGILLLNPQNLFDIGFQLSFSAVISIIYFYQKFNTFPLIKKLNQTLSNNNIVKYALAIFLVSLSAQIGTLPLTAVYFNRIPILSLITNIFAIPLIGLIVALGFTSIIFSTISPWLASVYGALNQELLSTFIKAISWIAELPFSNISIPTPTILQIIAYFSLLLFLINKTNPIQRKRLIFISLILLNLIVWQKAFWNDSGKITWIQFDVGQGDAALVHLPRGKTLLIDGGEKRPNFDNGQRVIAPYLRKKGIKNLDAIILTHPHNDHAGGLIYILNHFKVKKVITAGTPFKSKLYQKFQQTLSNKKIPLQTITAPDSIIDFPGTKFLFLSPTKTRKKHLKNPSHDINNQSLVLRILFGKTRFLFMGDAEKQVEENLLLSGYPLLSNTIKAGHHGSPTSSTPHFLQRVNPSQAVISVGENNRFGHPSDFVIKHYQNLGTTVHRTDQQGAIIFKSNGKTIKKINWQ